MRHLFAPVRLCLLAVSACIALPAPVYAHVSCLLFPLSCLKPKHKYGEEVEAMVLSLKSRRTDVYTTTLTPTGTYTSWNPLETTKEYFISFQVDQTRYVGWRKDTVIQMMGMLGGHRAKPEEWFRTPHTMRFEDENFMGLKTPVAAFKVGKKDWKFVITDIVGADGIDECPPYFGFSVNQGHCKPQLGLDRAKIEADIAAKLAAQNRKPVWEYLDQGTAMKVAAARTRQAKDAEIESIIASASQARSGTVAACTLKDEDVSAHVAALDDYPAKTADGFAGVQQYVADNKTAGANCSNYQFLSADVAAAQRDWAAMRDAFMAGLPIASDPAAFGHAFDVSASRATVPDGNLSKVTAPAAPVPADLVQYFQPVIDFALTKWSGDEGVAKLQARVPLPD